MCKLGAKGRRFEGVQSDPGLAGLVLGVPEELVGWRLKPLHLRNLVLGETDVRGSEELFEAVLLARV
jgi:hypothetical protein